MKYAIDYFEIELISPEELLVYRYGKSKGSKYKYTIKEKNWFDSIISSDSGAIYPSLALTKYGGLVRQKIIFRSVEKGCIKFGYLGGILPFAFGYKSPYYATKTTVDALLDAVRKMHSKVS